MADQLIKVDYDKIWDRGKHSSSQKKGTLYRGNSQKMLERRVIDTMMDKKPFYWGTENEQGKLTFCSPKYYDSLFYSEYWLSQYNDFEYENTCKFPHAFHPIMMEINASNYKGRIYRSTGGEGLVIKGPISLDDITILYSTHIDKFMEQFPSRDDVARTKHLKRIKDAFEKSMSAKGIQKDDMLESYGKCPDEVIGYLLYFYHELDRSNAGPEHFEAIARSMEALRAKLR